MFWENSKKSLTKGDIAITFLPLLPTVSFLRSMGNDTYQLSEKMSNQYDSSPTKKLWEWIVISILLPFLAPILFFYLGLMLNMDVLPLESFNLVKAMNKLFVINGIYLFFGFTLLLDLFNEHKYASVEFSRAFYLIVFLISLLTCFLFIYNLKCYEKTNYSPTPIHIIFNYFVSVFSLIVVIRMKIKIIKKKSELI